MDSAQAKMADLGRKPSLKYQFIIPTEMGTRMDRARPVLSASLRNFSSSDEYTAYPNIAS